MPEELSHEHHYVPRWYQKRFLAPGQQKLWHLDLKPDTVKLDGNRSFTVLNASSSETWPAWSK
jgi:hypothetical protein